MITGSASGLKGKIGLCDSTVEASDCQQYRSWTGGPLVAVEDRLTGS